MVLLLLHNVPTGQDGTGLLFSRLEKKLGKALHV
jgi:hypothetical protein